MILGVRLPPKVRHWRRVNLRLLLRVSMMPRITRVPLRVRRRVEVVAADGEEEAVALLRLQRTMPVRRTTLRINKATTRQLLPSAAVADAGEIMSSTAGN